MERKNTILLTVIAVATLLVAVVGATFAYFTATTTSSGTGDTATGTTATVNNVTLNTSPAANQSQIDYPGGALVVGLEAVAAGGEATLNYNINGTITSTGLDSGTELSWTLYESSTEVGSSLITGCSLNTSYNDVPGQYSYGNSCQIANLGTQVASGAGTTTDGQATIKVADSLHATTGGTTTYYYLVVRYPESDDDTQNDDQGATITANLSGMSDVVVTPDAD